MAGSDFRPGTVLAGRFTLEDLLDENAGASFWRATDRVLARDVAVHLLAADDERAPDLLAAARRSALVTDGHLLRVLDAAEVDRVVYVVHEWGSGVSLDRMLAEGPLSARRAAWLVKEVAEAISTAHLSEVAHGSLLPENVLVSETGAVKLIGFAVDAVLRSPRGGGPKGPRRVGDDRELDPLTADVVDLGALLYAALVGRWPGTEGSTVPVAPLEHGRPLRPRQVRAGVPRPLDAICERVLNGDAHPQTVPLTTAHEVYAALSDYIGDPGATTMQVPATGTGAGAAMAAGAAAGTAAGLAAGLGAAASAAGATDASEGTDGRAGTDGTAASGDEPTRQVVDAPTVREPMPDDDASDAAPDVSGATVAADATDADVPDTVEADLPSAGAALAAAAAADPDATQAGVPVFSDESATGWAAASTGPAPGSAGGAAGASPLPSDRAASPAPPPFPDPPQRPLFADGPGTSTSNRVARPLPDDTGSTGEQRSTGAGNGPVPAHWGPDAEHAAPGSSWGADWFSEEEPRPRVPGRRWLRLAVAVALVLVLVVVAVVLFDRNRGGNPTPPAAQPSTSSSPSKTTSTRLTIAAVRDFDPEGQPPSENPDEAKLAIDGKPLTAWTTVTYRGNPKLGGLKSGVGLLVDLGKPASVGSVHLDLLGTGTSLKLLAAPGATSAPTSTKGLTTVASAADAGQGVDLRLAKAATTRWLVVWLTSLPSAPGGYQGRVAEISVRS